MAVDPSVYALSTPARFLRYLREPADADGRNTDLAQELINGYSKAIQRFTRRQWNTEDAADKIFRYRGNGYLSFGNYEARQIYTVTLYTDKEQDSWRVLNNQTTTQAAEWRANPANKTEEGTYFSLQLPEVGRFNPYYNQPTTLLQPFDFQVTVNADWGIGTASIPDDVVLALHIACANAWRNPEAYQSRQLGPLAASDYESVVPGEEEGLSLPRASRALLSAYRRRNLTSP